MRGKAYMKRRLKCCARITPAHAGKSQSFRFAITPNRDHPRPCGEKSRLRYSRTGSQGSPPPMRGKAVAAAAISISFRITPAHAGKRLQASHICRSTWDHPRPCGEKKIKQSQIRNCQGSPPPMRGKAKIHGYATLSRGITPAHAGKSEWIYCKRNPVGDHPRPCGEKQKYMDTRRYQGGSPPPMRGKGTRAAPHMP